MSAVSDHLLAQLRAEKAYFKYDYGNSALDPWLTEQLITMLEDSGITDLRNVAHFSGTLPMKSDDGLSIDYVQTAFYYDASTGKEITGLGGAAGVGNQIGAEIAGLNNSDVFAVTHNNDYKFTYHCQIPKPGFPIFTVSVERIQKVGSPLGEILPVAMMLVSVVAPGIGTAIGQSVLSVLGPAGAQLAATYPAIATAIGNTALSAATNGGDIEKAVISTVANYAGAEMNTVVTSASDLPALGRAAAVATSNALTGGDVQNAVALSLLQSGVSTGAKAMSDALSTDPFNLTPSGGFDYSFDASAPTVDASAIPDNVISSFDFANAFSTDLFGTGADMSASGALTGLDLSSLDNSPLAVDMSGVSLDTGAGSTTTAGDAGAAVSTDASGVNWDKVISNVSAVAITALKLLPAFQQAGRPPVRVGSTTVAGGATTTVNADGTITTHYPDGRVTKKPAEPGQPYFLADGSTVTNNGDGTYTVIHADGKSATMRYGAGLSGNTLLIGAGILGALLVLR